MTASYTHYCSKLTCFPFPLPFVLLLTHLRLTLHICQILPRIGIRKHQHMFPLLPIPNITIPTIPHLVPFTLPGVLVKQPAICAHPSDLLLSNLPFYTLNVAQDVGDEIHVAGIEVHDVVAEAAVRRVWAWVTGVRWCVGMVAGALAHGFAAAFEERCTERRLRKLQ